jgi:hypothetical protein
MLIGGVTVLDFLGNILSALEDLPNLILQGCVDMCNYFFAFVGACVNGLFALLPGMPTAPSIPGGVYLNWLNWFYPVGDLLTGIAALITMYLIYLGVRWALNLLRAL